MKAPAYSSNLCLPIYNVMLTQDDRGIKSEEESVSVVIPCYNHGRFLAAAIESVLNQTHKDVEVIVVDDGSEDNTKEICTRYEKVKYIYQQNAGLSEARNTGIRNCLSNYLIFLDADDWLLSDAISTNLKYINRDKHSPLLPVLMPLWMKKTTDRR